MIKLLLYISIQVDLRPLRELQLHTLLTTFLGIEILRKQGHPNSRASTNVHRVAVYGYRQETVK